MFWIAIQDHAFQVVIVPCGITANLSAGDRKKLYEFCENLESNLKKATIRVKGDYRENYSPGWKFNHWELKGVPLRIEVGPRDIKNNQFVVVRRDNGDKTSVEITDTVGTKVQELLDQVQVDMFNRYSNHNIDGMVRSMSFNPYFRAKKSMDENVNQVEEWSEFLEGLDNKNLLLSPFCGGIECEDQIKAQSKRYVLQKLSCILTSVLLI